MPTDHTALTEPQLLERAERLYRFVQLYADYMQAARDYGTGELISMVEVHTLTMIADSPGITVTELAQMWDRTKGAVSQNVKKLEQKGLIYRQRKADNGKVVHLFATEAGERLSRCHKDYDRRDVVGTQAVLLQRCTPQELADFFKVVDIYTRIMLEEPTV